MADIETRTPADEMREAAARLRANPERPVDAPLADWLEMTVAAYADDVYGDEVGCNPGASHGDCDDDCPGHEPVAMCDRCGHQVAPASPAQGSPCRCWDAPVAVARALNGSAS